MRAFVPFLFGLLAGCKSASSRGAHPSDGALHGGTQLAPAQAALQSGSSESNANSGRPLLAEPHRIAAGEGHTCVIGADKKVRCWGRDALGSPSAPGPVVVPNLVAAQEVFASGGATCARASFGAVATGVVCWGDNLFGQVHLPASITYEQPDGFPPTDEWDHVDHGSLGPQGACALRAGFARCWGASGSAYPPNAGTRFGLITPEKQAPNPATGSQSLIEPEPTFGAERVEHIAFGMAHSCALLLDHSVRCQGDNSVGQLGRVELARADFYPEAPVAGLSDVVQIEAGISTTCARTARGEAYCWGANFFGQLAVSDETRLAPYIRFVGPVEPHDRYWPKPLRIAGLPRVRQMSVGGTHVCAIAEDTKVYCWGSNDTGQLGDGTSERRDTPTLMLNSEGAVDVAASSYGPESHTCVLFRSGAVRCVGRNDEGELGAVATKRSLTLVDVIGE